jgi:uncharacterized protein (TIGR04141 family)
MAPHRIGQLIVGPKRPSPPRWLRHVKPYAPNLPELMNETVSAVLLVPVDNRTFALTFGYGRFLLRADSWEDGFGLKVTLNAVPPGNIKSMAGRRSMRLPTRRGRKASVPAIMSPSTFQAQARSARLLRAGCRRTA